MDRLSYNNEKKYKLSVAITCYNQVQYIEQAIESVRSQNIEYPYEILIGDDGSSDGSYELIIEKYGNLDNIRIFQQSRDNNVKEFSNFRHARLIVRLMKEVQGQYFAIMDGDDYYCDSDGFRRKIEILDNEENQDCVVCISNFKYVYDDQSEVLGNENPLHTKKDFVQSFVGNKECEPDSYCHFATALTRSKIIPYLEEQYTQDFADTAILWWVMNYGMRFYDNHVTYAYRKHTGTIFTSINDTTKALRFVLMGDVLNKQWNNKWKKYTWKKFGYQLLYLFSKRKSLHSLIDYETWLPCAKKYNGWGYAMLCYEDAGILRRLWLDWKMMLLKNKLFAHARCSYIIECIKYLFDRKVTLYDKIQRIKNREGLKIQVQNSNLTDIH